MTSQTCNQKNGQNSKKKCKVVAIIVPFPMQGHLNEALHLSHLITSYGIQVHYLGYTPYNHQAKFRLHGRNTDNLTEIQFHDLQLPTLTSIPPNQDDHIMFPGHLQPLFDVSLHLRQPMFRILQELSSNYRRIVVIHDTLMASVVQDVKLIPNAETFALHSISAFSIFFYIWESMNEKPFKLDSYNIPSYVPTNEGCFTPEFSDFIARQSNVLNFESGRLYNTSRLIEGKYMDLLEQLPVNFNKKLFAVGPLNAVQITGRKENRHQCLEWLDKQGLDSVIYVSFGTSTTMTDNQIRELASGLEKSGQKFIWVLRHADKLDVSDEAEKILTPQLPEGYEERIRNRGMVVREWAPQAEILAHQSTGGFISHCGWNSCMESISMGVPIVAWPMHSDQPKNSILVTRVLRIGVIVRDWEDRAKLVTSRIVENRVLRLMVSEEGREMRKRAAELGRAVRESVAKGGVSRLEVDSFVAHITR